MIRTDSTMKPKALKNAADYEEALARIETLFDAKPGTPNSEELDLLVTLVENYESKAFPIELPDPISAIRFRLSQQG